MTAWEESLRWHADRFRNTEDFVALGDVVGRAAAWVDASDRLEMFAANLGTSADAARVVLDYGLEVRAWNRSEVLTAMNELIGGEHDSDVPEWKLAALEGWLQTDDILSAEDTRPE